MLTSHTFQIVCMRWRGVCVGGGGVGGGGGGGVHCLYVLQDSCHATILIYHCHGK